ncbi:FMN-binding negative transcriptional regulator [Ottowia thiooxydans]|uniref:FMN-binding negative transcriptional regulator n=1 Tax=Ottowia thiooxydans TaxID=219182 RepID=UPI00040D4245|nr:FMN-binding negative transcriptional regulator [Ottowia thiooxydans]
MYLPQHFAESNIEETHRIIRANPLGMLVRSAGSGFEADHVPFLLEANQGSCGVLIAHVARANPVWQEVRDGDEVLVVFRGVEGYMSPNWYPGKLETHRRVPTWNYEVVHAHGKIHVRDEEKFVRRVVARLTHEHEASQPQPWKMGDAPTDYLAEQLGRIVGIEVILTRVECKRKLNQHHSLPDREGAIRGLESRGNHGLAQAMRDTLKPDGSGNSA